MGNIPRIIMPGQDQLNLNSLVNEGEMQTMELQGTMQSIDRKLKEMYVMEQDYKISLNNAFNLIEQNKRMIMLIAEKLEMTEEIKKLEEQFEQERINNMT